MKQTPEQLTFTRREFSQMMALFLSLVGVTATARAKPSERKTPVVTPSVNEVHEYIKSNFKQLENLADYIPDISNRPFR